ncbi:uncharacterized protein [Choristoneura fumiferana]|uniref:uncharacterized protein n=1 Tax=Choristoneura fumiferana TaxID=7141 RepID=UPI003D155F0F
MCTEETSRSQPLDLTTSFTETTTFIPILIDDEEDKLANIKIELMETEDYIDLWKDRDEQMFNIEDVRGHCDIVDWKPLLDISSGSREFSVKQEPGLADTQADEEAERQHSCWKRSAMLVYKRLTAHKYACHFLRPVSDDLAPEYSNIVKRPMDLSTIRRNIKDGVIRYIGNSIQCRLKCFTWYKTSVRIFNLF